MADTASTSASSSSSSGSSALAALSASTIASIRQAALASAPPSAAAFINARFAGAPVASASSSAAAPAQPAAAPEQPAAAPAQPAAAPAQPAAAPATTSDANASSSIVGASLAQPTISFIREQILANAPSAYAQSIADQFTASSSGSSAAVTPVQPAASSASGTTSSAIGASLAAPVVDLLRQEIVENVPAEYAQYILAQFAGAPSVSSTTETSVQATAGATVQTPTVSEQVATYLTA